MSIKNLKNIIKPRVGKISAIMAAVFAVLLTIDLVLKHCAVQYGWEFTVIPGLIEVVPMRPNRGAAFSFLADTDWGRIFFIVFTFIMLLAMIAAFLFVPDRFIIIKLVLAMLAAGALGNLIDRLALEYVRDFVDMNIFGKWACCNFADFWIVLGVILGVVDVLFLNEYALMPLPKRSREAAALREEKKKAESALPQTEDAKKEQEAETQPIITDEPTAEEQPAPTESAPEEIMREEADADGDK